MNEPQAPRTEPRWPVELTLLAVLAVMVLLPGRVRLLPAWCPYAFAVVLLAATSAAGLAQVKDRWLRLERGVILGFFGLGFISTVAGLSHLIHSMLTRSTEINGLQLLTSSIGLWVTNVLIFSLLYWQIDRGGPVARAGNQGRRPDWLFPQDGAPDGVLPGWEPAFIDYLFLGYCTATAFSPTDALPLTPRAKLLMMVQSAISLVTIVVVASRAINILGG